MEIRAVQDRGCSSAAKFSYHFPSAVSADVAAAFADCELVWKKFSRIVPVAKDLLSIKKPREFQAEVIIGGRRAIVYFNGSAKAPPVGVMNAFAERLRRVGYDSVVYSSDSSPPCGGCRAGLMKGCVNHPGFAAAG